MKRVRPKVGDTVYLNSQNRYSESGTYAVTRVGRKWFYVKIRSWEEYGFSIDDWVKGNQFVGQKGDYRTYTPFESEAAYQKELRKNRMCSCISKYFSWAHNPNPTYDQLEQIMNILNLKLEEKK